ncbi:MAG: single-stranded DNA-binding protein [Zetaproteobacteria bacterium CG12_big_fil_rev_8_21_14_0_65_55_1124]|nr:MAG: single-stranded DNA-binding protein [Zetaproteobacteria bacterium CG1_02_55_237]PIS19127.1 MAG: single-stranded DNA-binding protein [Zetaproteobacteria bacterium CG08_land_8_20_14_0_20_55_17]PIW43823.1 MAG: single-stranded DNA-binding protein [Zetaproteobacteria bacterium CG12_big_fil_rev_8_21_14_0_65_55_1124]PIY52969.1 MAG: single-stranded DNA-binding protein [Zetaproteobacteria bacterium CG_4_10_14_0_8_um_filter_55_43]PIZ37602.1 MAG: single-stranded DNA-binding protein [Zetaproteobact
MLNKAILIGNLGADPETRYMQDGTCVCNIRIATTERFKDKGGERQERTEWHRVVLWGKLGEIANQYLHKGSQVYIEGKIETRKWTNKEGVDVYSTEIRANEMKMLGGKGEGASRSPGASQGGSRPAQSSNQFNQSNNDPFADSPAFGDVPVDDDIPF